MKTERGFRLWVWVVGPESLTGDLLVISPVPLREAGDQPGGDPLTEEDLVRVTGEVRKFDIASAEQKIGAGLEADALDAYVGTPAIIADSVSLKPPTAKARDRDSV